jgi:hypothetical protein
MSILGESIRGVKAYPEKHINENRKGVDRVDLMVFEEA